MQVWRPQVAGVSEVLHAHFPSHAYPLHTHDTWTLLVVDSGVVRFRLGCREHSTSPAMVTLLPPGVPHDGRSATAAGFRKRVIYLHAGSLDLGRVGAAVERPGVLDPVLLRRVDELHGALRQPSDAFEAESLLALLTDRLRHHLGRTEQPWPRDPGLASRLRELLDAHVVEGLTLGRAAAELGADPTHLVRVFTRELGMPPHRYLVGRRLDAARRLLLAGGRAADVATEAGFYDQAHLTRHFKRFLGVTPGTYAAAVR